MKENLICRNVYLKQLTTSCYKIFMLVCYIFIGLLCTVVYEVILNCGLYYFEKIFGGIKFENC